MKIAFALWLVVSVAFSVYLHSLGVPYLLAAPLALCGIGGAGLVGVLLFGLVQFAREPNSL
jgi:hypothetical protein